MASKTNFYFYFDKPAKVKIKQVKFKEQVFDIDSSKEVMLDGISNWNIPSRFVIKNLSEYPVTLNRINFNVESVDSIKRPIRLENQKREKDIIVDLQSFKNKFIFKQLTLEPNVEYSIKFTCYILQLSDK